MIKDCPAYGCGSRVLLRTSYPGLAQGGGQDPVDERRCLRAAESLGGLYRFVDRALRRNRLLARKLVRVQQLRQPHPEDRALERGDPIQGPALGVLGDQLVQLGLAAPDELCQLPGEGVRAGAERLLQLPVEEIALVQSPDRGAALIGPTHGRRTRRSACRPEPRRRRLRTAAPGSAYLSRARRAWCRRQRPYRPVAPAGCRAP